MLTNRYLRAAVYTLAGMMIVLPMFETLMSAWPIQMGETNWRFGIVGLLSRASFTPLLGVLLLVAVAAAYELQTLLRILSIASGVLTAAVLGILPLFSWDASKVRGQVRGEAEFAFDLASGLVVLRLIGVAAVLVFFALGCRGVLRSLERKARSRARD